MFSFPGRNLMHLIAQKSGTYDVNSLANFAESNSPDGSEALTYDISNSKLDNSCNLTRASGSSSSSSNNNQDENNNNYSSQQLDTHLVAGNRYSKLNCLRDEGGLFHKDYRAESESLDEGQAKGRDRLWEAKKFLSFHSRSSRKRSRSYCVRAAQLKHDFTINKPPQLSPQSTCHLHTRNWNNKQRPQDEVTLCTLGVGTTFGASATAGKCHSVSVVTNDDCTLLRVRRADFQEIFNEQSHLMDNIESSPFCSFGSSNHSQQSNTEASLEYHGDLMESQKRQYVANGVSRSANSSASLISSANQLKSALAELKLAESSNSIANEDREQEDLANLSLEGIDSGELSNYLMRVGWVLRILMLSEWPKMIQNRRVQVNQLQRHWRQREFHQLQHQAQQQQHRKQLVSMGSRSHLFGNNQVASGANLTKSTGRKVANYVASSFMRSSNSKQQVQTPGPEKSKNSGAQMASNAQLFASSSFDSNTISSSTVVMGEQQLGGQMQSNSSQDQWLVFTSCMLGREMVDWLLELSQSNTNSARFVGSRLQAVSMWQVLLERRIIVGVSESSALGGATFAKTHSSSANSKSSVSSNGQSYQFQFSDDQHAYYRFCFDLQEPSANEEGSHCKRDFQEPVASESNVDIARESLWWSLKVLSKLAPDACFRLILAKQPHERSLEEVDIVYEELLHLKALSHLTNSVKRELAACVTSEHHSRQNTVIFNQGDVGDSWYIILRGSVNVVIVGKGVVCTLHEGDDFGKLALVNDAPRAATIVTNESSCYFLRVDKHNFNTILRDVEANTVRLKEHGEEVLILQKVATKESSQSSTGTEPTPAADSSQAAAALAATDQASDQSHPTGAQGQVGAATLTSGQQNASNAQQLAQATQVASALKYMVMAGTAEKMLEHLLETRIDGQTQIGPLVLSTKSASLIQHDQVSAYIQCHGDNFLEDFILTHKIFMPTGNLCSELLKQYHCQTKSQLASPKSNDSPPARGIGELAKQTDRLEANPHDTSLDDEYLVAKKRRVVKFVRCWLLITRQHFFQEQQIQSFLTTLHQRVKVDAAKFNSLQAELKVVAHILELHLEESLESRHRGVQRWIDDLYGNILPMRRHSGQWDLPTSASQAATDLFLASLHQRRFEHKLASGIQREDELVFRVYCADHSFATLKTRIDAKAAEIKLLAARKLNMQDKELILVHVKSNGERIVFNDMDFTISTGLSVNGRVFVCPIDHIDAISPLPEQDPFQEAYQGLASGSRTRAANFFSAAGQQQLPVQQPNQTSLINQSNPSIASGNQQTSEQQQIISSHLLTCTPSNLSEIRLHMSLSINKLEEFSSRDVAYCLTQLAWPLLKNLHEFELVYTVFGRNNFQKQITANLNVFLRHFNELQYWVVTQICLSTSLSKRVQILRKFIKIAAHCKDMQNLNAFFAIIMGLSNMAVARLTQTWERLPSKLKRTFSQFESLIDPSRNHRRYRIFISKTEPPIIPFMPLFLKDMTFAHEGNKTNLENGLINFEKMQMVAQTLRTIRYCKSKPMKLDSSACKFKGSIRSIELFFRDLKIIDNQRTLTQMSHQLEHRKT